MKNIYKGLSFFLLIFILVSCKGEEKAPVETSPTTAIEETEEKEDEVEKDNDIDTEEEKDSEVSAEEVVEQLVSASSQVNGLKNKNIFSVDDKTKEVVQRMDGEGEFDPKTGDILKGTYQIEDSDGTSQKIEFVGDEESTLIVEKKEANGESTKDISNGGEYFVNPNYFELVDIINSLKGDLVVEDEGSSYKLTLRSQNVDLYGLFQESYSLKFKNFTQNEAEKHLEVKIDKESKLMESLILTFTVDDEEKGYINLEADSKFEDFKVGDSV